MAAKYIGLWIDHKKAIIASYKGETRTLEQIDSEFKRWSKSTGGARGVFPYVFDGGGAAKKRTNKINEQHKRFFKSIFKKISSADKVLIMGPGTAKVEFANFFEKEAGDRTQVVGMTNKSKMTNSQIAAQTRKFFKLKNEATERRINV